MRSRAVLFVKGICMGIADVIPGVSGGTLALILGIYREFVDTLRGLDLRLLEPGWALIRSGGKDREASARLRQGARELNLGFLVTLVAGIATAIGLGSLFIPTLLQDYSAPTKGFFFGLIVASVYLPARMIRAEARGRAALWGAVVAAIAGIAIGWVITDPQRSLEIAREQVVVVSRGESLKEVARRGPTAATLDELYWAPANEALRSGLRASDPALAAELEAASGLGGPPPTDKKARKARSARYEAIGVPAGARIAMPRPALWFIAVAGAVAICAMILPGISGSYILLIFGVYFFVLNALKGLVSLAVRGEISGDHLLYVGTFGVSIVVGILLFARLLSALLRRYAAPTLGLLVGLMIGCLRGVWPFLGPGGANRIPALSEPYVVAAFIAASVGFAIVIALTFFGARIESRRASAA